MTPIGTAASHLQLPEATAWLRGGPVGQQRVAGSHSLTAGLLQSIEQLEKELLNGQKLQGPQTSAELHRILKSKNAVEK